MDAHCYSKYLDILVLFNVTVAPCMNLISHNFTLFELESSMDRVIIYVSLLNIFFACRTYFFRYREKSNIHPRQISIFPCMNLISNKSNRAAPVLKVKPRRKKIKIWSTNLKLSLYVTTIIYENLKTSNW